MAMKYIYYPGCSLKSTGRAYEESLLAVFKALDVPYEELSDWNCCGATSYMSINESKAFAISARNLALAEAQAGGHEGELVQLVAPCSACYLLLIKTRRYMEENPDIDRIVRQSLKEVGLKYEGNIRVRHPVDVLVNDIGLERIRERVQIPLKDTRVASYYGCLIVRPFADFDDPWYPMSLDRLVEALGGEAIDWSLKTRCCGGMLTGTVRGVGLRLGYRLIGEAQRKNANLMITTCPLCQFDLECFQEDMNRDFGTNFHMPILYFTQLMGMAFGLSEKELGIQRLFVKPEKTHKKSVGG
jgi:heterodisulfide reductase subunit B